MSIKRLITLLQIPIAYGGDDNIKTNVANSDRAIAAEEISRLYDLVKEMRELHNRRKRRPVPTDSAQRVSRTEHASARDTASTVRPETGREMR